MDVLTLVLMTGVRKAAMGLLLLLAAPWQAPASFSTVVEHVGRRDAPRHRRSSGELARPAATATGHALALVLALQVVALTARICISEAGRHLGKAVALSASFLVRQRSRTVDAGASKTCPACGRTPTLLLLLALTRCMAQQTNTALAAILCQTGIQIALNGNSYSSWAVVCCPASCGSCGGRRCDRRNRNGDSDTIFNTCCVGETLRLSVPCQAPNDNGCYIPPLCGETASPPPLPPSPPPASAPPPFDLSECSCSTPAATEAPERTCSAAGDPHYYTFAGDKFDFYGRGLYDHARFTIASCGCEVVVQTLLAKLIKGKVRERRRTHATCHVLRLHVWVHERVGCLARGCAPCMPTAPRAMDESRVGCVPDPVGDQYRSNSGISAVATRVGSTIFTVKDEGKLTVRTGTQSLEVPAYNSAYTATHGCCQVHRAAVAYNKGKKWAWAFTLPGGVGAITVLPYPSKYMKSGFMYALWISLGQSVPLSAISGLCMDACPARLIPSLPSTHCFSPPNPDHCYPVRTDQVLFGTSELAALEPANNLPAGHTRTCTPLPPGPPQAPPIEPYICAPAPPFCSTPSLEEHQYYASSALVAQGTPPQAASECAAWCVSQAAIECEARAAYLTGETLGCGFDPSTTKCALFAADQLATVSMTDKWAVSLQCESAPESEPTICPPSLDDNDSCEESESGTVMTVAQARAACVATGMQSGNVESCTFDYCTTADPDIPDMYEPLPEPSTPITLTPAPSPPPSPPPPSPPPPPPSPPPSGEGMYFQGELWHLVRRVKTGSAWHPATDQLQGTETYGDSNCGSTDDCTFSVPWSGRSFSQYLFATGDMNTYD